MPVLFMHGTRDWLVPLQHSQQLCARAQEPKRLRLIEDGRHAEELFEQDPGGFVRRCVEWFQHVFDGKGTTSA